MPWELENVALNPTHAMKRRSAARMEMEPVIAGTRLRLRQKMTISDEAYETNKDRIELCVNHGVVTAKQTGGAKAAATPAPEPVEEPEPQPEPEPTFDEPDPELENEPPSLPPVEDEGFTFPSDDELTPVEVPNSPSQGKKKTKRGKR